MSQFTVQKSLANDFGGNWNPSQFHKEIQNNTDLSAIFIGLSFVVDNDNIDIIFSADPNPSQLLALNGVIAAHVPVFIKGKIQYYMAYPIHRIITFNQYTLVARFSYGGSDKMGLIDYIEVLSYLNDSSESYSIKVTDARSFRTLAERTNINNTDFISQDVGAITNIPTGPSVLELYIKKNGTNDSIEVQIDEIKVYHGNGLE